MFKKLTGQHSNAHAYGNCTPLPRLRLGLMLLHAAALGSEWLECRQAFTYKDTPTLMPMATAEHHVSYTKLYKEMMELYSRCKKMSDRKANKPMLTPMAAADSDSVLNRQLNEHAVL